MIKMLFRLNKLFLTFFPLLIFGGHTNNEIQIYNVAIIGAGVAGLSAAKYLARVKLNPVVIEGGIIGGQINKEAMVSNWPALKSAPGTEITDEMHKEAVGLGAQFIDAFVKNIDIGNNLFTLDLDNDKKIKAKCIIVATGAKPKKLNLPGHDEYLGKGVALCAKCDGPFFKNKKVIVIGGDYSALREISILDKFTDQITIVTKKEDLEGPLLLVNPVKENPKVKLLTRCAVQEIVGDGKHVTGIKILNTKTNKVEEIPTYGVFICVGWTPVSELVENKVMLDAKKSIVVTDNTKTSVNGIFAAGDVTNKSYHQAPTASGFGYMAAMDAENYLKQAQ